MRCRKIKKLIYLQLSEQISENKRKILESHLSECPQCTEEYALMKKAIEAIRSLQDFALPEEISEKIKARVRKEREEMLKEEKPEITRPHPILKYALVGSSAILILFFALLVSIIIISSRGELPSLSIKNIQKFSSEKEFRNYLDEGKAKYFAYSSLRDVVTMMAPEKSMYSTNLQAFAKGQIAERYSETTVQVPGIDEPDIVKTDGEKIYSSTGGYYGQVQPEMFPPPEVPPPKKDSLTKIIKALPVDKLSLENKIEKSGNLLLRDDILVILSEDEICGFDVSNPKSPQEKWKIKLEEKGSLIGARLYKDKIYFITRNPINEGRPSPVKPLSIKGKALEIRATDIYHPTVEIPVDLTYHAFILDTSSGKIEKNISFVGSSGISILYMSENALYLTYSHFGDLVKFFNNFLDEKCQDLVPQWVMEKIKKLQEYKISDQAKFSELQFIMERYINTLEENKRTKIENEFNKRMKDYYSKYKRHMEKTGIVKIDLKDLDIISTGEIPGTPLNQFSLDEYKGYLRVATTISGRMGMLGFWGGIGEEKSANDVYVLDRNLKIAGKIQELGLSEQIYSVRFIEDKGYVVTFRQIDPFFVFDLSNPEKPKLKGQLKIPGYSSYLHPITKDKILGIGQEDAKVKISLFDVSDAKNPKEIDKYTLDENWSDISNTHHAFLQDKKHEIFFLPAGGSGYIFSYRGDKLELKKVIKEILAKRAIYINDYLYIIGENKIVVINEINFEKINEIEI